MTHTPTRHDIKAFSRTALQAFVAENVRYLSEDETLAVLDNAYVTPAICGSISQTQRLVALYSVRLRLAGHRLTPQAHATKLIHYLYWTDLVRLSLDVKVPATVRRAIEKQLLNKIPELPLGERISTAKRCSGALIKVFLFDGDPKVFAALLINQRLREEDLVHFASSPRAAPEQLNLLAADPKWSFRYAIRKAIVMNAATPRSTAASQLRYLSRRDLRQIHSNPGTSVYLRRCIERLRPQEGEAAAEVTE
jgi:hypothetical protein